MARITAVTDLHILEFSNGDITNASSFSKNAIFDKFPSGNWYATQRPGINISEDASRLISDARGRGVYYWNKVSSKYFINNDTVYKDSYSAPLAVTMSAGLERVYLFEIGDYLVIIDQENNEGWVIDSAAPTVLVQITDPDFPASLAKGGVSLNGKLFLYTPTGDIVGSAVEDPTTWNPLNFINSEVEQDGGILLAEHHQHVVAIGKRTLEFFYDAANPNGSPLNPRLDVSYSIGAVDLHSFWNENDLLFWIGTSASGGLAVFMLQNFQYQEISTPNLSAFLDTSIAVDGYKAMGSGFTAGGRTFYVLSLYSVSTDILPTITLVYEPVANQWSMWELGHTSVDDFPLMGWTKTTANRVGEGILSNGDLITLDDNRIPEDNNLKAGILDPGIIENGILTAFGEIGATIPLLIQTGNLDFGNRKRKFQGDLHPVMTPTDTSQVLTVQWSDNSDKAFNTGKTMDTSNANARINRMGAFRQRNYRMTYQGDEQIELEGLETAESV